MCVHVVQKIYQMAVNAISYLSFGKLNKNENKILIYKEIDKYIHIH